MSGTASQLHADQTERRPYGRCRALDDRMKHRSVMRSCTPAVKCRERSGSRSSAPYGQCGETLSRDDRHQSSVAPEDEDLRKVVAPG